MNPVPTYFLGANAPGGFYSLYSELIPPAEARRIYLLKGGPGCGKSTLMRRVEAKARQAGLAVERILCSGDPDSLDAVLFPDQKIAIADATAPHVLEPKFPGAVERYVNLGDCYDYDALQKPRNEIMTCMRDYPACYARAYRCLEAAAALNEDVRAALFTPKTSQRLARRAAGILRRELKDRSGEGPGQVKQRFLTAITHKGAICRSDTVLCQCRRLYILRDGFGLGHELLLPLLTGAMERGYDAVACPDPMAPERLQHLLLPQAELAFVTDSPVFPFPTESLPPEISCRVLRPGNAAEPDLLRTGRSRLRFAQKVSAALRSEAVQSLAQAKEMHDALEKLYNPYVDFDRVNEIADRIAEEIIAEQ